MNPGISLTSLLALFLMTACNPCSVLFRGNPSQIEACSAGFEQVGPDAARHGFSTQGRDSSSLWERIEHEGRKACEEKYQKGSDFPDGLPSDLNELAERAEIAVDQYSACVTGVQGFLRYLEEPGMSSGNCKMPSDPQGICLLR